MKTNYNIAEIPFPKTVGEIGSGKLHQLLKEKLKGYVWFISTTPKIYLVDRKYQLVTKEDMVKFLEDDKTDLEQYIADYHDCDDFAWALLGAVNVGSWSGIAFGFAFSRNHAFNVFTDGKDVYIIEPQRDYIWKVSEIPQKYKKFFLPVVLVMM